MNKVKYQVDLPATMAAVAALILWSIAPNVIKSLTQSFDFASQNLYRYIPVVLMWLPYLAYKQKTNTFDNRLWKISILPSIVNCFTQMCWAAGMYFVDPGLAALLLKSQIILIPLFVFVFIPEERILYRSIRFWTGLVLAISGVLGVTLADPNFSATGKIWGILAVAGAAFGWSSYTITVRLMLKDFDPKQSFTVISIYTTILTLAVVLIVGICKGSNPFVGLPTTARPWLEAILSGIFALGLGHTLYYFSVQRIGATIPIIIILLQPFGVLSISYFMFKERITASQLIFGLILIAGGTICTLAQQKIPTKNTQNTD